MASKTGDYPIPFDLDGNLKEWVSSYDKDVMWKPNRTFTNEITYHAYGRGRSSVTFYFFDASDIEYPMFISDFHKIIDKMVDGVYKGEFTFTKRGQSYGLKPIISDEE